MVSFGDFLLGNVSDERFFGSDGRFGVVGKT